MKKGRSELKVVTVEDVQRAVKDSFEQESGEDWFRKSKEMIETDAIAGLTSFGEEKLGAVGPEVATIAYLCAMAHKIRDDRIKKKSDKIIATMTMLLVAQAIIIAILIFA